MKKSYKEIYEEFAKFYNRTFREISDTDYPNEAREFKNRFFEAGMWLKALCDLEVVAQARIGANIHEKDSLSEGSSPQEIQSH